ncbi:endolytic transglycosylase MltG [Sporolactobacillus shoreae]|uniref:endolytic transglycosylase MltG n=1 Tax=Sporolactobacillus shoreae TaxID=1465501 RepID=UPI0014332FE3|nr:endolytic transglycosylase MltG [Sporolactobacillus shoreae]
MKLPKLRWQIVIIIVSSVIVLSAVSAWGFSTYYSGLLTPVDSKNNQKVTVTIPAGSSLQDVGQLLEKKGLIRKAWAFEFYAKWNHLDNYRAGTYSFTRKMSVDKMMALLKNGQRQQIILLVDVRQDMWVSEIAGEMAKVSGLDKKEILSKLSDREYVRTHYMNRYPFLTNVILAKGIDYPLEGYLAPGVYRFIKGKKPLTLDQMVDPMLTKTGQTLEHYSSEIKQNQLGSVHKVLTLASLIEQEAPDAADREKIAGVFFNRLNLNMKLQTDPSVAYGLQRRIRDYTQKDLTTDTPFNTYTRTGLTVGPIGSPAPDAIEAVLNPVRSKNLFFYARPNGKIYYSQTYAEHQAIIAKYSHEWANKN